MMAMQYDFDAATRQDAFLREVEAGFQPTLPRLAIVDIPVEHHEHRALSGLQLWATRQHKHEQNAESGVSNRWHHA